MRASRGEGGRASALGGSLYFLSSNVSYNGYMFLFGLAFCVRARAGAGGAARTRAHFLSLNFSFPTAPERISLLNQTQRVYVLRACSGLSSGPLS